MLQFFHQHVDDEKTNARPGLTESFDPFFPRFPSPLDWNLSHKSPHA